MTGPFHIGVDVGGTFTDFALFDTGSATVHSLKVLTTPEDPSAAIFQGLEHLCGERQIAPSEIRRFVHGTTLVGNAVIERKGARIALITTSGFKDVLEFRRELRYDLFEPHLQFPTPLVPRSLRLELEARMNAKGESLKDPSHAQVEALTDHLRSCQVEGVAVCLLHSYVNSEHERMVGEVLADAVPEIHVSLSSDVLPQVREYVRTSATVINAYVQPLVCRYLDELVEGLAARGCAAEVVIVSSTGGTISTATAKQLPILLVESGPAAGAVFAARQDVRVPAPDRIAFDMGGTTAKVCVIRAGRPAIRTDQEVARTRRFKAGSGLPIGIPVVDLLEVGAGGGSIAEVDLSGLIRVGPRGAGAYPGPACYALGGTEPTVSDANLVLGYLDESAFLGGDRSLDRDAALRAIQSHLCDQTGLDATAAAFAIYRIVTETMAEALRVRAAEVNVDIREYELFAFGGAAGIHAVDLARGLGINRIICPPQAGVFSAAGMLATPLTVDLSRSRIIHMSDMDMTLVDSIFAELEAQAATLMSAAVAAVHDWEYSADMSYVGQEFEISVPFSERPADGGGLNRIRQSFEVAYASRYGHALEGYEPRVVTWRLRAAGALPPLPKLADDGRSCGGQVLDRDVFFSRGGWTRAPVYTRASLPQGEPLLGPAVVQDVDTTLLLPPDSKATVDATSNVVIESYSHAHG